MYLLIHRSLHHFSHCLFYGPNPSRFNVCGCYRNKMNSTSTSEMFRSSYSNLKTVVTEVVSVLAPRAVNSKVQFICFSSPPEARAVGGLAEQSSMASVHVETVCWTLQAPLPNKHSCTGTTLLLLEQSLQGSAVGTDPEIVDYRTFQTLGRRSIW